MRAQDAPAITTIGESSMTLSMYQASVPLFTQYLGSLSSVLAKGAAHAEARKIDPGVFLNARLAPDMYSLARQIVAASEGTKMGIGKLVGVEAAMSQDEDTSFAAAQARLAKTLDYLKDIKPAQIDGSEDREIILEFGANKVPFTGRSLLFGLVIPNFLFHCSMAYAILRHNGVELSKRDFLGTIAR
jgi:uncharacterized protein